jgi:hypothetical protein
VNIAVKAPSQEAMADLEYEVKGEMRKVRGLRPPSQTTSRSTSWTRSSARSTT